MSTSKHRTNKKHKSATKAVYHVVSRASFGVVSGLELSVARVLRISNLFLRFMAFTLALGEPALASHSALMTFPYLSISRFVTVLRVSMSVLSSSRCRTTPCVRVQSHCGVQWRSWRAQRPRAMFPCSLPSGNRWR